MENVLDRLNQIVEDQGLTPEVQGVVLGSLMVDNVWEDFIVRTLEAKAA
jgi:hypothetical protein